ncbi:MAG: HlyC/CorC family transporter [Anaerolineae bacterium]|nr:HlyC/CorC family transporter [Anaerolineae bacterium]
MTELLIILLLTGINGVFAMSEAAVIAARRPRLQNLAEKGNQGAQRALALKDEPSRFLSTVQVGITLIGTLLGAFGGATVATSIAHVLQTNETLAPYANVLGLLIVVLATTYIQLIIGELVPKRLALHRPEKVAAYVARPMYWLEFATSPVVRLLSFSTDTVLRLIGAKEVGDAPVTEEEISAMLTQGVAAGIFEETEQEMVESVFKLGDRRVTSIMTPRTEIVWLDVEDESAENQRRIVESRFSRFPVCQSDLDHVVGMVRAKDLLPHMLTGSPFDLKSVMVPPVFVPESISVAKVVELFRQTANHVVLVINEYGGLMGLVTTQDVLEEIVGDIEEQEVVVRDDGSYLIDGMMSIENFRDLLDIEDELPGEDEQYETIAGFVMLQQGRIPRTGDRFEWENFSFEVVDMDGHRVDKILVARLAPAASDAQNGADNEPQDEVN